MLNYFYYNDSQCEAVESKADSEFVLIFLAGLGGTLLSDPVSLFLLDFCKKNNIHFCQPNLQSMPNFGKFTLRDDCHDICSLLKFYPRKKLILFGFSTGCQDIIYLLKNTELSNKEIFHAFLQAPVSDREYEEKYFINDIKSTWEAIKNKENNFEFLYRDIVYIKERWADLYIKGGKDDYFSSDLPIDNFQKLNEKNINMTFLISENDEFAVNPIVNKLKEVQNGRICILKGAKHCLYESYDFEQLKQIFNDVFNFLHSTNLDA